MKFLLMIVSVFILSACSHVAPYEKEVLAEQKMLASPMSTRSTFDAHVFSIREGSFGAESGFSGGCGCK